MNAKEHPDFVNEQEKLTVVQGAIREEHDMLTVKSQSYGKLAKEVITDPDVFNQLVAMDRNRVQLLTGLMKKPYFGRVDFCELGKDKETFYVGRTSVYEPETKKLMVLDWRAPLAGLYYSGEIGEVMYASPSGLILGDLELKRQYEIEEGDLINIFDKGLTPMDEFLQKALWEKKDNRLGDIVTTIQDEQNQIIRASKDGVLMIQGVAGSGKTTIVLHRIAYLMYTYRDFFQAENILMVVPNMLFLDYISDVLPDLGVHDIEQVTYRMLFDKVFEKKTVRHAQTDKLKQIVHLERDHEMRRKLEYVSAFKGSMTYKSILDAFADQLMKEALPKGNISVRDWDLYSHEELSKLFHVQYAYLPLYKRKEKIRAYIKHTISDRIDKRVEQITQEYDAKIKLIKEQSEQDNPQKQESICTLIDEKNEQIDLLRAEVNRAPKTYFAMWNDLNVEKLIKNLLKDAPALTKLSDGNISFAEAELIASYTQDLAMNAIEDEDLHALIYLKFKLEGSPLLGKYTHIIVDEAQDYSPFQMHLLKMLSANQSFTIVGDIAQGIHAYRGISNWNELTTEVFTTKETTYKTIQICYRSTKEIVDYGNAVLTALGDENVVPGKPALRSGNKPQSISCHNKVELIAQVSDQIQALKEKGYKSIAVMCKSEKACDRIYDQLSRHVNEEVQVLTGHEAHYRSGITLITPQYSKGLEFDAVLILDTKNDRYKNDPLHIKLLYVAISRALHELYVYHVDGKSMLFKNIDETLYEDVG